MFSDSYILVRTRGKSLVLRLLAEFLPGEAVPSTDEYPVPQYAGGTTDEWPPEQIFREQDEILRFLEEHPQEPYYLHWRSDSDDDIQGTAHFLRDGALVLGISSRGTHDAARLLRQLIQAFPAECGYTAQEDEPPDRSSVFRRRVKELGGWCDVGGEAV